MYEYKMQLEIFVILYIAYVWIHCVKLEHDNVTIEDIWQRETTACN